MMLKHERLAATVLALVLSVATLSGTLQHRTGASTAVRGPGVITIGGVPHPYLAEGSGLPCIVTGPAPLYAPLFSERLKQHIRLILVDFKRTWGAEGDTSHEITMAQLVGEIEEVRRAFDLDRVCLVGHSTAGLLALEYALNHPDRVSRVILIGVPPHFDRSVLKARTDFWETDASSVRKAALQRNMERLPNSLLQTLSPRDEFALRYVRNGPRYFYDASYDFYWALAGRAFSAELLNRFLSDTVLGYDPRPRLITNTVPIFLALGRYDYAVPHSLWNHAEKTPRLTHHLFELSGHFPMIEEPSTFDDRVIAWLEASKIGD